jgi:hypothetical protein
VAVTVGPVHGPSLRRDQAPHHRLLGLLGTFQRVTPRRPINADVPAPEEKVQKEEAKPRRERRSGSQEIAPAPASTRRREKSTAPKLLVALVVLALVFIVVAVVGGSGGDEDAGTATTPAPTPIENRSEDSAAQTPEALGYPSFATNNTVRIGGSDPASNAAAAALAVFPSTAPGQRPAALTLVDEGDWGGAIAAAVLMAPPVRAPVLFSGPDELPAVTAEAVEALDPQGSGATDGASFFVVGDVAVPSRPGEGIPVDSGDPAGTAAQIATLRERLLEKPPKHLVVAPSSQPAFAMPAAAWAARSGDPVLFSDAKKLPSATAAALREHPKVPVYVLGPPSAISAGVLREVDQISKRVERVAGKDPVANALALARYADGSFGWNLNDPGHGFVLARDDDPADAAAAAPLSASGTWGPLLLTDDAATLPADVRSYFLDVKPGYTTDPTRAFYNHVWVIGDQEAIDVTQQAEVNELAELAKIGGEG